MITSKDVIVYKNGYTRDGNVDVEELYPSALSANLVYLNVKPIHSFVYPNIVHNLFQESDIDLELIKETEIESIQDVECYHSIRDNVYKPNTFSTAIKFVVPNFDAIKTIVLNVVHAIECENDIAVACFESIHNIECENDIEWEIV